MLIIMRTYTTHYKQSRLRLRNMRALSIILVVLYKHILHSMYCKSTNNTYDYKTTKIYKFNIRVSIPLSVGWMHTNGYT